MPQSPARCTTCWPARRAGDDEPQEDFLIRVGDRRQRVGRQCRQRPETGQPFLGTSHARDGRPDEDFAQTSQGLILRGEIGTRSITPAAMPKASTIPFATFNNVPQPKKHLSMIRVRAYQTKGALCDSCCSRTAIAVRCNPGSASGCVRAHDRRPGASLAFIHIIHPIAPRKGSQNLNPLSSRKAGFWASMRQRGRDQGPFHATRFLPENGLLEKALTRNAGNSVDIRRGLATSVGATLVVAPAGQAPSDTRPRREPHDTGLAGLPQSRRANV